MPSSRKIAVIGNGIAGITIAYQLARQGAKVTIYDKEKYPAMGTSYANGAQLSVCNSQVWNTWPMVRKGISWMFRKDAPFYIHPSLSYDKMRWLLQFLNVTRKNQFIENTKKTIELALASRAAYTEIIDEEMISFNQVRAGILHVYTNEDSLANAISHTNLMESSGCDWKYLSPDECRESDPSLRNNQLMVGGIMSGNDTTGDCHQFVSNLSKILVEKYHANIIYGHDVKHISPIYSEVIVDEEAYDDIVIATGTDSQRWGKKFGDHLNIYPVKGYSVTVTLPNTDYGYAPWVSLLDDDAKIVCSRVATNQIRIAGTAELAGNNLDIKRERILPLLNWVNKWFPNIDTRKYSPWAGLRPMTPNMLPHYRQGNHKRVWYHTGHGHLGFTMAPGTAKILSKLMLDK